LKVDSIAKWQERLRKYTLVRRIPLELSVEIFETVDGALKMAHRPDQTVRAVTLV
jgi:hypothetical protein